MIFYSSSLKMVRGYLSVITISLLAGFGCTSTPGQSEVKQKSFEWVFGNLVDTDRAKAEKVLAGTPGERYYFDNDGDGKPDEIWFIDTDPRHNKDKQPILVRVIDEDGDLELNRGPDTDSDLYIADWNADGTVDAIVDYEDLDGDQDADRMGVYFYDEKYGLRVWWSSDDGDDNLLWYTVDYTYYQRPCENSTHFGGDESFVSFRIKPGEQHWTPFFENPFLFYDCDKDGITEEVIRLIGEGNCVNSLRWSFDADNDATPEKPRDYDVSISAYAAGWSLEKHQSEHGSNTFSGFNYPESQGNFFTIRNFPAGPVIKRNIARTVLNKTTWARVLMTWDENDLNIARTADFYTIERWEGVIGAPQNDPGFEMPGVGWPDCGSFNKRYEIVLHPEGPNKYYFNPADRRIHIRGSDRTWLKVDYDYDKKMDMYYLWQDTDNDGVADKVSIDVDGDTKFDDSYNLDVTRIKLVDWNFQGINAFVAPVIKNSTPQLYYLSKVLAYALEKVNKGAGNDPVWNFLENKMHGNYLPDDLERRLLMSDESMLYYLRIIADKRIVKLKETCKRKNFWSVFDSARSKGDLGKMAELVSAEFGLTVPNDYDTWLKKMRFIPEKKKVAWDNEWLPPNWGWESEKAAFRCYDGHFDVFGKRLDTLIFPTISIGNSYHLDDNGWGMDILHVGKTGGCGGLVLYVDDVVYPLRNEKNPGDLVYSARLFKETNDTVTIEFKVTGAGPRESPYTVYIRPSAVAGRADSPVEVNIRGGRPGQNVKLGIVLNTLPEEEFFLDRSVGIMGLWGFQQPEIGWIGTGIVFPKERFLYTDDTPDEHRVVLRYTPGKPIYYHIQADWLRGHRFSCCPGAKEWMDTLKKIAESLRL